MVSAFRYRRNCYTIARTAIHSIIISQMRSFWETVKLNKIISDLKDIFKPEVCLMRYECLDEFLSCKMRERKYIGLHLAKMLRIHKHLTVKLKYEMMDNFAS
jgi:hypothetical protein